MSPSPLHLRLRNLPAGTDLRFTLDPRREARFVLGDPTIGLRFLLPNVGDAVACRGLSLEPLALTILFGQFVPHLTILTYVAHQDDLICGRIGLPPGADLQILTACDLQALFGDTSWRVRVPPPPAQAPSSTPGVGSPHRRTAKPRASGSR